jgi:hypothetical protein
MSGGAHGAKELSDVVDELLRALERREVAAALELRPVTMLFSRSAQRRMVTSCVNESATPVGTVFLRVGRFSAS